MNRYVFVLAACLALCAASPVKRSSSEGTKEAVKSSRQDVGEAPAAAVEAVAAPVAAAPAAVAAPAAPTEDDEDDDYDYLDAGDDDDDDDDEEEDDDEEDDGDYFERFFEDILGDDDEDDEPAGAVVQAVEGPVVGPAGGSGNAVPIAPAPAPAATTNNVVTTLEASVIPSEDDSPAYDDEDDVTSSGAEEDASSEDDDDGVRLPEEQQQAAAVVQPVAVSEAPAQVAAVTEDDEDDDDDEDDLDVTDLAEDDDDDEDEEEDDEGGDDEDDEEDEEDEEDDDYVASRARSLDTNGSPRIPETVYVTKYNRYVDSIIGRIKKVLKKSFDPVNVRLHSTTKVKNNKNKNRHVTKRPKENGGSGNIPQTLEKQLQEESLLKAQQSLSTITSAHRVQRRGRQERRKSGSGGRRPSGNNKNNQKNKGNNKPRARATLMGLSSIRREGDVSVNVMSSHTSVRSNFLLGPLTLKVEKEFGRGETKELRSASAVTEEMSGVMSLRINQEGTASLHSIRVLQPKQVRIESPDDHDRTREFVWRRSSHIARLVSRKLTAAARTLLGNQNKEPNKIQGEQIEAFGEVIPVPVR